MKTIQFNLLLFLFLLPALAQAEGIKGKYTKEKKIYKSFVVNPDALTSIANKYGNVYVTTWDENKTEIDVIITVSGNNEEQVTKRINSIDILFDATMSKVSALTQYGSLGSKTSMEINYTVKIPKKGNLNVSNQYGSITLGVINGATIIECQYGTFSATELNSDNNSITMQYSDGSNINHIAKAYINAQYSGLTIKKANQLNIKGGYTDVNIHNIGNITYDLEYGGVKIGSANTILGTGDYTSIKLGTISTELFIKTNYSDIRVGSAEKSVKKVTINSSYTNVDINLSQGLAYDFELSLAYGNLNSYGELTYTEKREKNFSSYYKGYCKASGAAKVNIITEYGNINLGLSK